MWPPLASSSCSVEIEWELGRLRPPPFRVKALRAPAAHIQPAPGRPSSAARWRFARSKWFMPVLSVSIAADGAGQAVAQAAS
jgi:hypothetical protein